MKMLVSWLTIIGLLLGGVSVLAGILLQFGLLVVLLIVGLFCPFIAIGLWDKHRKWAVVFLTLSVVALIFPTINIAIKLAASPWAIVFFVGAALWLIGIFPWWKIFKRQARRVSAEEVDSSAEVV